MLIEGKGLININLDGFKEVFELGLDEIRIGKEIYKACSIPGMIILKLIAYDDRPDERIKDVIDINTICQYYPSIESEFIWGNHFDLYEGDLGHEEIGVIVLGREVRKLVSENEKLLRRLARILDNAINETTPFLKLMIQDPEKETIEMKRNIMKSLKKGFMHLP